MTHGPILAGSVPDEGQVGRGVTTSPPGIRPDGRGPAVTPGGAGCRGLLQSPEEARNSLAATPQVTFATVTLEKPLSFQHRFRGGQVTFRVLPACVENIF